MHIVIGGIKWSHGESVSCCITSEKVEDAKLSIKGSNVYLCQNYIDGLNCYDRFGYKYSYVIDATVYAFRIYSVTKKEKINIMDNIVNLAFPIKG